MTTRVYVPSAPRLLLDLMVSGGVGPVPLVGHAVTATMRSAYADTEVEDLEYLALSQAAQDSVALLGEDDPMRRVVVAVDAEDVLPIGEPEVTVVRVDQVVPLAKVAAVHIDDADAEGAVAEARGSWTAADDGAPDAVAVLERCRDHELGWWATQELPDLLDALGLGETPAP